MTLNQYIRCVHKDALPPKRPYDVILWDALDESFHEKFDTIFFWHDWYQLHGWMHALWRKKRGHKDYFKEKAALLQLTEEDLTELETAEKEILGTTITDLDGKHGWINEQQHQRDTITAMAKIARGKIAAGCLVYYHFC